MSKAAIDNLKDHPVPPIKNELGKYWEQPPREQIVIDEKFAVMHSGTFEKLCDYSGSNPTGVYEGKMWKERIVVLDGEYKGKWCIPPRKQFEISCDHGSSHF